MDNSMVGMVSSVHADESPSGVVGEFTIQSAAMNAAPPEAFSALPEGKKILITNYKKST